MRYDHTTGLWVPTDLATIDVDRLGFGSVDAVPRDYDWSEGYTERWEYLDAERYSDDDLADEAELRKYPPAFDVDDDRIFVIVDERETLCAECGQPFTLDANEVAHHVDDDGRVDHDADAYHVPYGDDSECVARTEILVGSYQAYDSAGNSHEELSDGPMMNYYYPVLLWGPDGEISPERAAARIVDLPLCLVQFDGDDEWNLALTGGGMDLSWEIVEAYVRLDQCPPAHFCRLPAMSGRGTSDKDRVLIEACRRTLTSVTAAAGRDMARLDQLAAGKHPW